MQVMHAHLERARSLERQALEVLRNVPVHVLDLLLPLAPPAQAAVTCR